MYALITGATSGIGKEIAKILASVGYDLVLVGRRKKRLEYMKNYFHKKYGTDVVCFNYDLSFSDNCMKLFLDCKDYDIDFVVNSAGFGKVGFVTDTKLSDDIDMINTNIVSVHMLTKLFAKRMKRGNIMNIASIAAFYPGPYMSEYGATKAYVLNLGRAMNYELKRQKKDVRITTVCPGPVSTEFNKVANADFAMGSMPAKECAKIAVKATFEGKSVIVPGLKTKILSKLSKLAPDIICLPIEYHIQTAKKKK